ncbi:MAG: hypothetical protein RLZZ350_631 [Verrucomicrobiota bacterium]
MIFRIHPRVGCLIAAFASACLAQNQSPDALWQKTSPALARTALLRTNVWVEPQQFIGLTLDAAAMRSALAAAPVENLSAVTPAFVTKGALAPKIISLPLPDGSFQNFAVTESSVMAPALAAQFPAIKTYFAQGLDDPMATARLDFTPQGFHAQMLSPNGATYIDPHYRDASEYVCYAKKDYLRSAAEFHCGTLPDETVKTPGANAVAARSGGNLRTYRLAVAATGEYTTFQGGTVDLGQAAIVTAVNRVTGIYETELAIRLVLVAGNSNLVYVDSATDPYDNATDNALLTQNTSNLNSVIGSANYDIGHVFGTGGGGLAGLGVVCGARKAEGETGNPSPTGDSFWVDYVAHEMGHQFGGNHTFNSTLGSCSGNIHTNTAYEPGSGTTIMAYAGICSTDNLQAHSDPYFHSVSFDEIIAYSATNGGSGCATLTSTGNTAPTVSAGASNTIPANTPFTLTASGSDANNDPLTYCWEERDLGPTALVTAPDNGSSPLFRSFNPTTNTSRTFPRLSDILSNAVSVGEKLPTTSRTMKFRVTARDNRAGGGGVNTADTTVTVVSNSSTFAITSHNLRVTNSLSTTVNWNVAGTTSAPISCANVKISLSTNSGLTFPIVLTNSTPNDGVEIVALPALTNFTCRLKVEAVSNIFFDINNTDFALAPGATNPVVAFSSTALVAENCAPTNNGIDPGETVTVNLALLNLGGAPTTNLTATLLATGGINNPSGPVNFGGIIIAGTNTQPFTFTGSGSCGGSLTATWQLQDGSVNRGTITKVFPIGGYTTTNASYTNLTAITIRDNTNASVYPSSISVGGLTGTVSKVTVTIPSITHTWAGDIDMILVGPGGQKTFLMSDAADGDFNNGTVLSANSLTFDDAATNIFPVSGSFGSGTYQPANYNPVVTDSDNFLAPAPALPYVTNLAVFNGVTANGTWSLYLMDDAAGDVGSLTGWILNLTVTNPVCCTSVTADLQLTQTVAPAATYTNGTVTFSLTLTNLGSATATNVIVTSTLPAGLKFISATPAPNATNAATLAFNFNNLTNLARTNLTVTALTTNIGNFTNFATVTSLTSDPVNANNTATAVIAVQPLPTISTIARATTNTVSLTWTSLSNLTYRVQFKTNLQQAAWLDLTTNLVANSSTLTTNLPLVGTNRFYRITAFP